MATHWTAAQTGYAFMALMPQSLRVIAAQAVAAHRVILSLALGI